MTRILAIAGRTSTGKSTVSRILASRLHCKVRHCGEVVKARASELGVSIVDLPQDEHAAIDGETRRLVFAASDAFIVEGRYLLDVLHGMDGVVRIVLQCSEAEQLRRQGLAAPSDEARWRSGQRGKADPQGSTNSLQGEADLYLDTDDLTPEQVADRIMDVFQGRTA